MSQNRRAPSFILILSGKRKSGKDYLANFLLESLGIERTVIIRLSGPLKERYALENNLDYEKLLGSSEYKEIFREKMIKWGEDIRNKEPGYFCHHAIQQSKAEFKEIWIISDARRKTDLQYFLQEYPGRVYTIRIKASESVRKERGWVFTEGVDDCESECGLDDFSGWNFQVLNDSNEEMLEGVKQILQIIEKIS